MESKQNKYYPAGSQDKVIDYGKIFDQGESKSGKKKYKPFKPKGGKKFFTHLMTLPLNSPDIQASFNSLKERIMELKPPKLDESYFQKAPMLHLTLMMFDFSQDDERFEDAKKLLQTLEPIIKEEYLGGKGGSKPNPLVLTLEEIDTFQRQDPENGQILFCHIKKDKAYETLREIANRIISEFYDSGILNDHEVKMSNTTKDRKTGYWELEFHLTLIKAYKASGQTFDARPILQNLSSYEIGVGTINEINLSNKSFIDTFDGRRIKRTDNGVNHDHEGFYACEQRIFLQ